MTAGKYRVLLGALYRAGTARRGGGEEVRAAAGGGAIKTAPVTGRGKDVGERKQGRGVEDERRRPEGWHGIDRLGLAAVAW
jgi:hypothetical protein